MEDSASDEAGSSATEVDNNLDQWLKDLDKQMEQLKKQQQEHENEMAYPHGDSKKVDDDTPKGESQPVANG